MKLRRCLLGLLLLLIGSIVHAQILRPFTVRYNNPSVRGNIVYISNSIISTNGVGTGDPGTGEAPPGGSSTNNGSYGINIDIDNAATTFIAYSALWKYLDNDTRPANWETTGYSDASWSSGNAQLGYGDGDETTVVSYGGNASNKYITTYFRKTINIPNPSAFSDFTINLIRDDGAVVYVNGVEVFRDNMPGGTVTHSTFASSNISGGAETTPVSYTIPTSSFVSGTNVIAVEMHQDQVTSSDLSFDLELIGNPASNTSIMSFGGSWKYLDNDTRPANWETTGFSDAGWASGNAQLGYGDGDETTVVSYGPDPNNKYTTTYFRKTINVTNPSSYANFIINLVCDDGAVVYVNGVEVARGNLPAGTIAHSTFALTAIGGAAESTPVSYIVPSSYFVNGNNTIAVEVHQADLTSSDISFDMELLASTDTTFNSSSSDLSLASCSKVLFAGLYWGAGQGSDGSNTSWITGETTCELLLPGASTYTTVTSSQTDYHNATLIPGYAHTGFKCFADITSLINTTSPNGTYTIANVASPAGITDAYGGWTIVIVYSNPVLPTRNLTVFDGNAGVKSGSGNVDIGISGFLTPPTGPVTCELGAVVYDGDRGSADAYAFQENGAPSFYDLTPTAVNPTSNANDMWNSTIAYKGSVVATRNPAFNNTLGYDATIIDLPNSGNAQLGNSQSSATVRFSSPSENYLVQVVTTSISQYNPSFTMEKTATDVNGGSLEPGDVLRYQIDYTNYGDDASTNTIIVDNIPTGTSFVPGSIQIDAATKTDGSGDDEAEYELLNNRVVFRLGSGADASSGGTITSGSSGSIQFDVVVASSCRILSCGTTVSNSARINYTGQTSGQSLFDSSGTTSSGCFSDGPVVSNISGSCYSPGDTILVNICPATNITLPWAQYAGYTFYSAMPFNSGNIYDPYTPVTLSHVYYAYYNSGGACSDTIRISVYINACPDIDDDDDGIPDFVEINLPAALQDADTDGTPNWLDSDYAGFVDNNSDGVNDNFDPGADSDNDGTPNFMDPDFAGYTDTNGDGINDNMDKDLDGIPNFLDLDSDNDGIPDVVESLGVDTDGNGIIDNYSDTDNDGLSQNVDGSNIGVSASGNGLGAVDTDGDGIPNYLDLDSDNDGVPDIAEVFGADTDHDGKTDNYIDSDGDGFSDAIDGDVGNDGTAENTSSCLLLTGSDGNSDGRADSYTDKNMDADSKPNPYDLDSDGDGIADVREAGFTDTDFNSQSDGSINSDGWDGTIASSGVLNLPDTDGTGPVNMFDIDSDDDGIPDNIEGIPTASYILPTGVDSDGDGLDNSYDNVSGFGGWGVQPVDTDGDTIPDYIDTDADNDGEDDIWEGNDFNFNGMPDDDVTLSGTDTDGDGLDDHFDNNNSSAEGTSAYMGNGGSTSGDGTPGSITVVQHTAAAWGCPSERDWRCLPFVLQCEMINFNAALSNTKAAIEWTVVCKQEIDHFVVERSINGRDFDEVAIVQAHTIINENDSYNIQDDINAVSATEIYYRLKTISKNGKTQISNIIKLKLRPAITDVLVLPNPVRDNLQVMIHAGTSSIADILIADANGKILIKFSEKVMKGINQFQYDYTNRLTDGIYYLRITIGEQVITKKISVIHK